MAAVTAPVSEKVMRKLVELPDKPGCYLMRSKGAGEPDEEVLGDAVAFVGVSKYPARIKCALLPWVALQDAEAKAGIAAGVPQDEEGRTA